MKYNFAAGDVAFCRHAAAGFTSDHVVCQLDMGASKVNVASCRPCLDAVLNGSDGAWANYQALTRQQASALGVNIAG